MQMINDIIQAMGAFLSWIINTIIQLYDTITSIPIIEATEKIISWVSSFAGAILTIFGIIKGSKLWYIGIIILAIGLVIFVIA